MFDWFASLLLLLNSFTLAAPATDVAPYGDCDEAWQAPHSAGAAWCRDHDQP